MTQAVNENERFRDPSIKRFLMGLDGESAALHPGVLVERDGVQVHHRREGDGVAVTAVSGAGLRALRARLEHFDRFVSTSAGLPPGGIGRLAAELSVPGPDLDAVETALRDRGHAVSAETCRQLLEAKDGSLDPSACPDCRGRHEAPRPAAEDVHDPAGGSDDGA